MKLQISETEDGRHVYETPMSSSLEQEVIKLQLIRAFLFSFPLIGFIEFSVLLFSCGMFVSDELLQDKIYLIQLR